MIRQFKQTHLETRVRLSARVLFAVGLALGCSNLCAAEPNDAVLPPVDFNRDILPILSDRCFHCHGPDESNRESDLRLDDHESVFADRGDYEIIAPHRPDKSELYRRITSDDPDERMPPKSEPRQLNAQESAAIKQWIESGAEWTGHWAFTRPVRPQAPPVHARERVRNPIDQFILAELENQGFTLSADADRRTLIRRVTLDLTGLPPTPVEVENFLADRRPGAYERLIDRLFASHRYGEHMAVPWLDAARYADTDGYQNDRLRYMWAWRDWVIDALNRNLPFDQFTVEQLAGDMLPDATLFQQIATGFCRNHRINSEAGSIPAEWHVEYVVDRVDTVGTIWLGLTIGCARCHDHKYDPVSQKEYYNLFAFFNNVPEWGLGPNNGNSPPFINVPKNWPLIPAAQNKLIPPKPYKLSTTQGAVVRPNPGGPNTVMVMQELAKPRPTYRLNRGQYNSPDKSEVLHPAVPNSLGELPADFPHNRLGLAQWLTDPSNPLTARVVVNRYWQQFFGIGLVRTSENFGIQGEAPSHPELLDWMATEFQRIGWDVKAMQRLIVTSTTYRQDSSASAKLVRRDPENRLLGRGPRVRLSGNAIRDQALALSGLLVEEIGGVPVRPYMPPGIWTSISNAKYKQDHGPNLYRRSLYTYWRRTIPPPTLLTFNAAEREICVVRKDLTSTPLQALTLMNNIVFVEASRKLAERTIFEGGKTAESRLNFMFRTVSGRSPGESELPTLMNALQSFHDRYRENPNDARQLLAVGESPWNGNLAAPEVAAYAMLASALMNLDEVITKE